MAIGKQLSDGNPDGTSLGQSSSDLISFFGKTAVDQRATTADVSTTVPVKTSGFGFKTSAQPIALIAAVNEILATLEEYGLKASS